MTAASTSAPYATLSPDVVLNAVESLGLRTTGSVLALNSYENRVYQIGLEDAAPVIAKFYRPARWTNAAILEEHQFSQELLDQEIPVIAPIKINQQTLHEFAEFRFALFPRKGGRALEVDNMRQLRQMGCFIARIHAIGSRQPFQHRLQLTAETYGYQPYQFLLDKHFIPHELKQPFCETLEQALGLITALFQHYADVKFIRVHGDCYAGNMILNNEILHIVDLDDCLMAPAVQDIWMMLPGSQQESPHQLQHILDGYYEFRDFDLRELHLIEALRTLRIIHYSGWLAKRWQDPAFPTSFPWFNSLKYWENELTIIRNQIALLDDPRTSFASLT